VDIIHLVRLEKKNTSGQLTGSIMYAAFSDKLGASLHCVFKQLSGSDSTLKEVTDEE
jgi:hypothetical protein